MAVLDLQRLSNREKSLLVAGALCVLMALGNLLVVRPIRAKHRDMREEAAAKRTVLKNHLKILAYEAQVQGDYAKVKEYVHKRGPEEKPDRDMLTEAERLATSCGLRVRSRKSESVEVQEEFLEEYIVRMEVEGAVEDMIRFLYRLRVSPQLMRVRKMELKTDNRKKEVKKGVLRITKLVSV